MLCKTNRFISEQFSHHYFQIMNQKLDFKVYTILICVTSFVSSLFACNVTNRFGEDCVYNCHCKLNTLCTESGFCPEGCQEGWFGPECQYKDMVASNDNQYMKDQSDGCLITPDKDGNVFNFYWHSSFNFTWMRLIFKEPGVQRNVTMTFSSQGRTLSWDNCAVSIIGNQTYNIDCDNLFMVDSLAIKIGYESMLCNVFVSGGREEPVELTSQPVTIWTIPSLNMPDWEIRMDSKNCTQKIPASSGQSNRTVLLNRYMFLDLKPFTAVRLLNYSTDSLEVFVYEDAGQPAFLYFTSENVTSLISAWEISAMVRDTGRIISLCQVENYEDSLCFERKKFAIHCNQPTHCMNESDFCIFDLRLCPSGCSDGFTGECCTSYCPLGTYGKNCSLKCDDKCTHQQVCHPVTGNCIEPCQMSVSGETCQTEPPRVVNFTVNGDKSVYLRENGSADFFCQVDGIPTPTAYLNGSFLSKIHDLTNSSNVVSYRVTNVSCNDSGRYFCYGRNGHENVSSFEADYVDINVTCKPRLLPSEAKYENESKEVRISVDSNTKFTVIIYGYPEPTQYILKVEKDNVFTDLSVHHEVTYTKLTPPFGQVSVTIYDAHTRETKTYNLNIKNEAGTVDVKFNVIKEETVGPTSGGDDVGTKVGIGVGVGLGVLLLATAIIVTVCIVRRRRLKKTPTQPPQYFNPAFDKPEFHKKRQVNLETDYIN